MKNYIGFSRDHSGSMRSIAHVALKDYNEQLSLLQEQARIQNQDTIVSVVTIGVGAAAIVGREVVNSNVQILKPLRNYQADANGTPMIASVFELINIMKGVPDYNDPDVSFLLMITTDGQENRAGQALKNALAKEIKQLVATDRWSFVFRVPRGGRRDLEKIGLNQGLVSILEWDQTEKGVSESTQANKEAFTQYFSARTMGLKSTRSFYANLSNVAPAQVKASLVDIRDQVKVLGVPYSYDGAMIRDFVQDQIGTYTSGNAFYQLSKTEKKVQTNKKVIIRDFASGNIYGGDAARQILGLPDYGTVRVVPQNLGQYDVFIQSTSVNRKLVAGTEVIYVTGRV